MKQIFPDYSQLSDQLNAALADFFPDRIFDSHVHITDDSDADDYLRAIGAELPERKDVRAMLIPLPTKAMSTPSNPARLCAAAKMHGQLDAHQNMVGQVYVLPNDTCEDILALTNHSRIRGLKCYFYSAKNTSPAISEYLPESAWQVANEKNLAITLHLARRNALSDTEDLSYIKVMTRKYPHAKLILAHCGRAFASWTCMDPLKQLHGIENIYYDLAAVCESVPMYYCLKYAGCDHVLWGSDYPICKFRGRAVSVGDGFVWADESAINSCGPTAMPLTVMQENLLAVYTAADMLELTRGDVERVFYRNSVTILGQNL